MLRGGVTILYESEFCKMMKLAVLTALKHGGNLAAVVSAVFP